MDVTARLWLDDSVCLLWSGLVCLVFFALMLWSARGVVRPDDLARPRVVPTKFGKMAKLVGLFFCLLGTALGWAYNLAKLVMTIKLVVFFLLGGVFGLCPKVRPFPRCPGASIRFTVKGSP